LGVAEAKGKLSEVLRDAAQGPLVIHSRGRDLAVVLAIDEYDRLTAGQQPPRAGGSAFLERVEALKLRHGGGVSDFEPARLDFVPADPFARSKTGRR
jgi:prevent-host-death family protein